MLGQAEHNLHVQGPEFIPSTVGRKQQNRDVIRVERFCVRVYVRGWFRIPAALAEHLGLVPSIHIPIHNCL